MADRSWMSYKLPFGKYAGQTLAMVRMNDLQYVIWLSEQEPTNSSAIEAVQAANNCIAYLYEVDPWAIEEWRK